MELDRTYWRGERTARLIDEAKHYPTVELCIAIGERLADLADVEGEADYWRDKAQLYAGANADMRAEIAALEEELRHMREGQR